jgi:hypothetical protein
VNAAVRTAVSPISLAARSRVRRLSHNTSHRSNRSATTARMAALVQSDPSALPTGNVCREEITNVATTLAGPAPIVEVGISAWPKVRVIAVMVHRVRPAVNACAMASIACRPMPSIAVPFRATRAKGAGALSSASHERRSIAVVDGPVTLARSACPMVLA